MTQHGKVSEDLRLALEWDTDLNSLDPITVELLVAFFVLDW